MAKLNKTNKSVKKRLRVTGTGKLKHGKCGKRHLNAHFTAKRRRQLRKAGIVGNVKITEKLLLAMNEQ
ncbi:MAG: 50S ribosomal protein L35 [Fimbriiglobus sp.]|nr:50S ribosomal protein L35 [Fimbriiglobus sp.]